MTFLSKDETSSITTLQQSDIIIDTTSTVIRNNEIRNNGENNNNDVKKERIIIQEESKMNNYGDTSDTVERVDGPLLLAAAITGFLDGITSKPLEMIQRRQQLIPIGVTGV